MGMTAMAMHNQSAPALNESSAADLFALSDEQILEIAPEKEVASGAWPRDSARMERVASADSPPAANQALPPPQSKDATSASVEGETEPPAWLAAQMKDAWGGEEAREFWDGVQQARSEAAAYRAAFATPEDARALKELYPGGVSEARAAAERARLLDDVDRAYFGAAGNSPEQLSASRAQLAQRMLREDPAAFREMVEAGIKLLREAAAAQGPITKSLASAFSDSRGNTSAGGNDASLVVTQLHPERSRGNAVPLQSNPSAAASTGTRDEAHVAAYAAFERAANEDLERSVGGAIERTLAQALPSFEQHNTPGQAGMQRAAPVRERLASSVRAEVEKVLQGDRQLGEQVAQILAARRFDNDSRAQIVRLIADRAQQLVPGAAKRVLNEWTQTTLAAHHGRSQRPDAGSARPDAAQASLPAHPVGSEKTPGRRQDGGVSRSHSINYRKFSDEQILDM